VALRSPEPALSDGVVTLRAWSDSDLAEIVACCSEEHIAWWLDSIPQPYTRAHARAYVTATRAAWRERTGAPFAVVDARDGRLLGSMSVRWPDRDNGVAEVGYWTRAEARGRGVAPRALRLVARFAFEELGAERLQLRAEARNGPSQRVAEKAGFAREGVLRSAHWSPRQARRLDWVMFSLVRGEQR
jgi:RimJ/RimL family protein N-acetyltransferase